MKKKTIRDENSKNAMFYTERANHILNKNYLLRQKKKRSIHRQSKQTPLKYCHNCNEL